ncbi:MAG: hypothetical protein L7S63_08270 [Flavobacteriales bacterium]|nr:hypothetical protein [Flavobacteriales bacterium]
MNKSISLLAALFLSAASTAAFANTHSPLDHQTDRTTDVQMDQARDGMVTLQVVAATPDGSTKRVKSKHRNMNAALQAYERFVSTLPHGSRIVSVAFLDSDGRILFSHNG